MKGGIRPTTIFLPFFHNTTSFYLGLRRYGFFSCPRRHGFSLASHHHFICIPLVRIHFAAEGISTTLTYTGIGVSAHTTIHTQCVFECMTIYIYMYVFRIFAFSLQFATHPQWPGSRCTASTPGAFFSGRGSPHFWSTTPREGGRGGRYPGHQPTFLPWGHPPPGKISGGP